MPQTKKKTATKTAAKKCRSAKKGSCSSCYKQIGGKEKMHIYAITIMSMIAAILLCANIAMVMV